MSQAICTCFTSGSMSKINRCCSSASGSGTFFACACASPFFNTWVRLSSARTNTGTEAEYIEIVIVFLQECSGGSNRFTGGGAPFMARDPCGQRERGEDQGRREYE